MSEIGKGLMGWKCWFIVILALLLTLNTFSDRDYLNYLQSHTREMVYWKSSKSYIWYHVNKIIKPKILACVAS